MPALAHIGIGFLAKAIQPKVNLIVLLIASIFLDLLTIVLNQALWPTHSLIMAIIWAIIGSIGYGIALKIGSKYKNDAKTILYMSLAVGLVIFSHWVLDLIGWPMTIMENTEELTGTPFWFRDTPNFGFGVYRSWTGALTMEIGFLLLGMLFAGKYYYEQYQKKSHTEQKENNPSESD